MVANIKGARNVVAILVIQSLGKSMWILLQSEKNSLFLDVSCSMLTSVLEGKGKKGKHSILCLLFKIKKKIFKKVMALISKIPSPWPQHFVKNLRKKFRAETNTNVGREGLKAKLILPKKYYFEKRAKIRLYKNLFTWWVGQERICPRQIEWENSPKKIVVSKFSQSAMKRIYFLRGNFKKEKKEGE